MRLSMARGIHYDEPMTPDQIASVAAEIAEAIAASGGERHGLRRSRKADADSLRSRVAGESASQVLPAAVPVWGDATDVRAWFRVSRTEAFTLAAAGKIVSERSGRRRRFLMASVDGYLRAEAKGEAKA